MIAAKSAHKGLPGLWVETIAEPIAQSIEGENGEKYRRGRKKYHMGIGAHGPGVLVEEKIFDYGPRGMVIDCQDDAWSVLSGGHIRRFDWRKCPSRSAGKMSRQAGLAVSRAVLPNAILERRPQTPPRSLLSSRRYRTARLRERQRVATVHS